MACNCNSCGCNIDIRIGTNYYNRGYFNDYYSGCNSGCSSCSNCSNCCSCETSNCSTTETIACPYGTQLTECSVYNGTTFEALDVLTSTPLNTVLEQILTLLGSATVFTADNGLRKSTATNVQLGGLTAPGEPLLQNTYIDADTFGLFLTGTVTASTGILNVSQTNAGAYNAIVATSVAGSAISGTSISSSGIVGVSTSGLGAYFESASSSALSTKNTATTISTALFLSLPSSTNNLKTVIEVIRGSSGTAANGIGGSIDYKIKTLNNTNDLSNRISSKWTDVTYATRTSTLEIYGLNNATTQLIAALKGAGTLNLPLISTYANNAAAIVGGLVVGDVYQTAGGTLLIVV